MTNKNIFLGAIISIVLTLIFFIQFVPNMGKPLSMDHGDGYLINFELNHVVKSLASGNISQLPNLPMFYGFKNTLFFSDSYITQGILALPIYIFTKDPIILFDVLALITIAASFFSMFILILYLTRNFIASIIGGIIYAFNPYVLAHFPDHLQLYSLQFLPLIFLFFEKSIARKGSLNAFLFFFFLVCELLSSLYYSIFLTIILPLYIAVRIYEEKFPIRNFLNKGFIAGILLVAIVSVWIGLMYSSVAKYSQHRNVTNDESKYFSAWLSDFALTGSNNFIYGRLRGEASHAIPEVFHRSQNFEQNLFLGIVPIILFLLSLKVVPRSRYKKVWISLLAILIVSILMSFGPKINLTKDLWLPGPYSLLKEIDFLLGYTRIPTRFIVFTIFSISIISAFTVDRLSGTKFKLLILSLILLLFIEFWTRPPTTLSISNETRQFYTILESRKDIKVIAVLPMGERYVTYPDGETKFTNPDSTYLLWATVLHNKKLINGYNGFVPEEYSSRVLFMSRDFPVSVKVNAFRKWGADGLILDRGQFANREEYEMLKSQIINLGVPIVVSANGLVLFDLTR